ncbi:hypothetical protein ACU80G_21670 [Bacillus mycoides]|uniref:Uncharacterized protein n=2 Tax=Bacillus cereus TaxID=1396 RepID=J8F100_BACCE|nr:hypothetical protein [Bacillus cereus]EJR02812.1 hypothetical protein II3_01364 [Bacillus cereus MC67]EOP00645.1 hypothetical protein II1_05093 [Bacillus cereus MC118]
MKKILLFLHGCLWLNICLLPLSVFIGGMATDPPDSTVFDFWEGFLFIQGISLIVFIIGFLILVVINSKKIMLIYNSAVLM